LHLTSDVGIEKQVIAKKEKARSLNGLTLTGKKGLT
jgi:hypothetical protein